MILRKGIVEEGNSRIEDIKRKPLRPRSEVWEHLTKCVGKYGEPKTRCNYCNKEFQADTGKNGTTSLKSHMGTCKKRVGTIVNNQTDLVIEWGDGLATWKFNQESARRALAQMIIRDEFPFRFVEAKVFITSPLLFVLDFESYLDGLLLGTVMRSIVRKRRNLDSFQMDLKTSMSWFQGLGLLLGMKRHLKPFKDVDCMFKSEMLLDNGLLEQADWDKVRMLCLLLKKIYDLTVKISSSSYITINLYLDDICDVCSTLNAWKTDADIELKLMAKRMKEKYDKYWENIERMNMLLYVAFVLDPKKKLEYVKFALFDLYGNEQATVMFEHVKKIISKLLNEYCKLLQLESSSCQMNECSTQVRVNLDSAESGENKPFFSKYKRFKKDSGKE
ncbi:hypothetical protein PTKIN_Ptkin08bG0100200 [Pterospermum kingtungense]